MADLSGNQSLPSAGDVSVVFDETQVPEDQREEILTEIDKLVSESQPVRDVPEEFLRPHRSGIVFPVVINLVAAAAVAAGLYFITQYFQIREDSIALESRAYFSAEAQLIEEILRESEERLARKDQEIDQIQSQLAQLDADKRNLEANLEDQVAAREQELRSQLQAELDAERARLAEQGQSEESIAARLAEIEAAGEQAFQDQLDEFRQEAQNQLDQLAAELDAREAQLEQTLAASREERTRIAEAAAAREEELRAELGAEIEALEESQQQAQARIQQLQQLREEETLLADRVLGSFAVIVDDIQQGRSEDALSGLDALEGLLRDQRPADTDTQRRRRTELALASTLRGLVQEVDVLRDNIAIRDLTTTDEEEAALEQQRAAELIGTAADVVQLAESAREEGRLNEARSLYRQALATIPSLDLVYPGILDLEQSRRETIMSASVGEAQDLLAAGSTESAISTYLTALQDIAEGDDDPLRDVADGIRTATNQNQQELLAAQQTREDDLQAELAERDNRIGILNQQLLTARNQVSTRDATVSELQTQLNTVTRQLEAREDSLDERLEELSRANDQITDLEDELASLQTELRAARARATGLQTSLESARNSVSTLEDSERALAAQIDELETELATANARLRAATETEATLNAQIAALRADLEARPEQSAASEEPPAASQQEIDSLNRQITQLTGQVDQLNATITGLNTTVDERDDSIEDLQSQLDEVQTALRVEENARESAQTELSAALQTVSGLESQIANLRSQRDSATGETTGLESEIDELTEQVAELQAFEDRIAQLTRAYEQAQTSAVRLAGTGNYETAITRILEPLRTEAANEILPAAASNIEQLYGGLITRIENEIGGVARAETLEDVAGLAEQVKRNIDDAQNSVAVQSYLTREPDVAPLANDLFEIIELSSRDISAPEIDYRLLGSVSRSTLDLVVVERLVALEPTVGDTVEIRRTQELGEEFPIALGTILEVTERRVVVRVSQIYLVDQVPEVADVVYVAQE